MKETSKKTEYGWEEKKKKKKNRQYILAGTAHVFVSYDVRRMCAQNEIVIKINDEVLVRTSAMPSHTPFAMSPVFTFSISKMTNTVVDTLLLCLNCVVIVVYPHGKKKKTTNDCNGMICCVACVTFCVVVVPLNSLLICVSPLICLIEWT